MARTNRTLIFSIMDNYFVNGPLRFFLLAVQENAEQGTVALLGVVQVRESDLGVHLQHFSW